MAKDKGKKMNDYYVYEWFIEDSGEVFYVGKGRKQRYKTLKGRNKKFNEIINLRENVSNWVALKGYFKKISQTTTDLNFHGDMEFYTSGDKREEYVDLVARFTDGQLQYIKKVEK